MLPVEEVVVTQVFKFEVPVNVPKRRGLLMRGEFLEEIRREKEKEGMPVQWDGT